MRLTLLAAVCLLCLSCSGCYLLKQGCYVLAYQRRAKPIDRVLQATTDAKLRAFLSLARGIKAFAVDSLGLVDNRNYSVYADIDRDFLVQVVTAAAADTFRPYQWWFPIVGSVPYKGFFDTVDARAEMRRCAEKGLDVYTWKADGFSSLGILTDPLYSFMREYSPHDLASLIIHEQTHATIYLKSQAQFNEEFASFVGDEGALRFLASTYGDTSRAYQDAVLEQQDSRTYAAFLAKLFDTLGGIYRDTTLGRDERLRRKSETIASSTRTFAENYDSRFRTRRYANVDRIPINNAYLCAHMTYRQDLQVYYRIYERRGHDLRATIAAVLGVRKSRLPPREFLRGLSSGT